MQAFGWDERMDATARGRSCFGEWSKGELLHVEERVPQAGTWSDPIYRLGCLTRQDL